MYVSIGRIEDFSGGTLAMSYPGTPTSQDEVTTLYGHPGRTPQPLTHVSRSELTVRTMPPRRILNPHDTAPEAQVLLSPRAHRPMTAVKHPRECKRAVLDPDAP